MAQIRKNKPRKKDAAAQAQYGGDAGAVFPVVGVGASAGGLEAFTQLLRALPTDTGMAFVLVQHLHPGYESALTEILTRETAMPVHEVEDGMRARANHVYIIPPSVDLAIMHGTLHLMPRKAREKSLPIDRFFRTLAQDQGSRAIGVILSGTASDGVLGLKAIKAEGGITFAQDEKTAKYDGMPHSAIAAGTVDFVLAPDKIALELARIARHPYVAREQVGKKTEALPAAGNRLNKIFLLLRHATGHDFTYYKHSTIQRRIKRRMLLHKLEHLDDYIRYLQETPMDVWELFHDILINVTGFFRDPEAFAALAEKAFPSIVKRPSGTPIRVWVPGCSTGEEAYSIAIALLEYMGDVVGALPIQVFATDIDEVAIEKARAGVYPENIIQDVGPERLGRFFIRVEGGYQISKRIRDMCIFAIQDVAKDPPFSKLDLISCRNLLIYLGPVLQKRIMAVFHYALKAEGFLFLGTAESIGDTADLFRTVDAKQKLYIKKSVVTPRLDFGRPAEVPPAPIESAPGAAPPPSIVDVEREADRILMTQYAPAAVVINKHMDIIHFRGRTGPYLEPAPGVASFHLLKMAREGLMLDLNAVVKEAQHSNARAHRTGITFIQDGEPRTINIDVEPIDGHAAGERHFLVVFEDIAMPPAAKGPLPEPKEKKFQRLEQELASTKEYLQSVIEQQETTNEELRSANEEIQSSNEELQSINEELETAKEELQSTNEELATVNDELESRALELERVNDDLRNLVNSVDIPSVIVDRELKIRRFTPQAEKLLNLIATDVGRPISDLKPNINIARFTEMIKEVVETVQPKRLEARDYQGHWYSARMHPYVTTDNKIGGAVIAFIDINELKRSLQEAEKARNYAEAVVASVRHPMLVLDKDLRVVSASAAYLSVFQVGEKETIGNLLYRLGNGQWAIPQLRASLEETVTTGAQFDNFDVTHEFEKIGTRTVSVSGRQLPPLVEAEPMVLMQIEDVTESRRLG